MELNQKTDALIVIDMQNDFTLPAGSLYVKDGEKLVSPLIATCSKFAHIFFTQDNHPEKHRSFASAHDKRPFEIIEMYGHQQVLWPDHCVQTTPGSEIVEELDLEVDRADAVIRKGMNPLVDSYSAFRENFGPDGNRATTGFGAMLHALGFERLFFVGLARDYCVKFSAEDAITEGFESFIIDDLTESVNRSYDAMGDVYSELMDAGVKLIYSKDVGV